MRSPEKLMGALAVALAAIFIAVILSSCAGMGKVSYAGNFKGIPLVVVVGK